MTSMESFLESRRKGVPTHMLPDLWERTADQMASEIERLRAELVSKDDEIEAARATINQLGTELAVATAPLTWTREKPTEPGWYFCRNIPKRTFDKIDDDVFRAIRTLTDLRWDGGFIIADGLEFAGPIPEPREPQS